MVVPLITEISPELKSLAAGPSTGGRGGMITKLEAAEIMMEAGGAAVIANGAKAAILDRIFTGEPVGTAFISSSRIKGKRRWIAHGAGVSGRLVVNAGAREAIMNRKASLLTVGVVRIDGPFNSREIVSIVDPTGHEFARGITNCASQEAENLIKSAGTATKKSKNAKSHILVTRDNIVLLSK